MYTEEFLRDIKYNELLKIAKTFRLRRQKTDKLIKLILKCQKESVEADSFESKLAADQSVQRCESDNTLELLEDVEIPESPKRRKTRSTESTVAAASTDQDNVLSQSLLRRRSFTKNGTTHENSVRLNKRKLSREEVKLSVEDSGMSASPSKKRRISGIIGTHSEVDGTAPGRKSARLSDFSRELICSEVQTSKDILELEMQKKIPCSPVSILDSLDSPSLNHSPKRKSLRGMLLESRLSNTGKRPRVIPTVGVEAPVIVPRRRSSDLKNRFSGANSENTVNANIKVSAAAVPTKRTSGGKCSGSEVVSKATDTVVKSTEHVKSPKSAVEGAVKRPETLKASSTIREADPRRVEGNSPGSGNKFSHKKQTFERKPTFSIGKSDKGTDGTDKKSGIPRFVSYARKIRVPNFKKVHQKAFEKMESLDEYVGRIAMASGSKTINRGPKPVFKPTVTSANQVSTNFAEKLQKRGSTVGKKVSGTSNSLASVRTSHGSNKVVASVGRNSRISNGTPVPLTARRPSKVSTGKRVSGTANEGKTNVNHIVKLTKCDGAKPKDCAQPGGKLNHPEGESNTPVINSSKGKEVAGPSGKRFAVKPTTAGAHRSALPVMQKENFPIDGKSPAFTKPFSSLSHKDQLTPGSLQRRKMYKPTGAVTVTDGGNSSIRSIPERAVLKQMAGRNPKVKDSSDHRRLQKNYIKGVRSNKRFELQMAKRGVRI